MYKINFKILCQDAVDIKIGHIQILSSCTVELLKAFGKERFNFRFKVDFNIDDIFDHLFKI